MLELENHLNSGFHQGEFDTGSIGIFGNMQGHTGLPHIHEKCLEPKDIVKVTRWPPQKNLENQTYKVLEADHLKNGVQPPGMTKIIREVREGPSEALYNQWECQEYS